MTAAPLIRHAPLNTLVAAAKRITGSRISRNQVATADWQTDAWEMYDLVGEQRYLAATLAGRLSQARLYVGKRAQSPTDAPEPVEDTKSLPHRAFEYFGDTPQQRVQMINRLGLNLFIAGDGWLVGIPRTMMPDSMEGRSDQSPGVTGLDDLRWRMLSIDEVKFASNRVRLHLGPDSSDVVETNPDRVWMIRVWRPHPRTWWEADSPTRSSLPVLKELVGLTMHISAQVDSRLAGAGLLIVPASAQRALAVAAGMDDPDSAEDQFTEALMEAMLTPINDRASASALVPLVVTVPDEAAGMFNYMTFAKPLDSEARTLRDEAIRRLALGQDAPPELLLGTSGMNHWGAWLVREDVVNTHLEPPLALICDAITTQYLWPVLMEQGMDESEAQDYVIWYDVAHLVQRPNRLADATALFDKNIVSEETLREAGGFGDADKPPSIDRPVEIAVAMAQANPALIDNMPEIVAAFRDILKPQVVSELPPPPDEGEDIVEEQKPPEQATTSGEPSHLPPAPRRGNG